MNMDIIFAATCMLETIEKGRQFISDQVSLMYIYHIRIIYFRQSGNASKNSAELQAYLFILDNLGLQVRGSLYITTRDRFLINS